MLVLCAVTHTATTPVWACAPTPSLLLRAIWQQCLQERVLGKRQKTGPKTSLLPAPPPPSPEGRQPSHPHQRVHLPTGAKHTASIYIPAACSGSGLPGEGRRQAATAAFRTHSCNRCLPLPTSLINTPPIVRAAGPTHAHFEKNARRNRLLPARCRCRPPIPMQGDAKTSEVHMAAPKAPPSARAPASSYRTFHQPSRPPLCTDAARTCTFLLYRS